MSTTSGSSNRRFTSLSETECVARLESHSIGRVGWNTTEGPQILPVSYAVRDGAVVFRTAPYGALSELRSVRQVAFEVDDFDLATRTGWSVLVRGWAKPATDPDQLVALWTPQDPIPWATGTRTLFITISLDAVTGRVISS
jgi:nitroimidazol reductase NimA-like FMN-containing flavoprotein (pyridoxamine 5'-phosphate oxidase superfamily)